MAVSDENDWTVCRSLSPGVYRVHSAGVFLADRKGLLILGEPDEMNVARLLCHHRDRKPQDAQPGGKLSVN